ncbi:Tubulin polyglutamylase complex subunit 2 [Taenia crassiceps]|uniref:Tubulin polyglutamylase complex subunit 2 n=1 Tax=Taenia crassiceps TaxID=6207 RepID=A0ABR4QGY5_9CEST
MGINNEKKVVHHKRTSCAKVPVPGLIDGPEAKVHAIETLNFHQIASTFSIAKVDIEPSAEASEDEIEAWEEQNHVKVPEALKNFYLTSNGLRVAWNGKYGVLKVFGGVNISGLGALVKFQPHCEPGALDNPLTCFTNDFKHLSSANDFFILSRCTNHAYVLLSPSLGIYLLNRSMELGYICEGFMEYIRLAMLHYMLDGWEYFLLGNADALTYEHMLCLKGLPHLLRLYDSEKDEDGS